MHTPPVWESFMQSSSLQMCSRVLTTDSSSLEMYGFAPCFLQCRLLLSLLCFMLSTDSSLDNIVCAPFMIATFCASHPPLTTLVVVHPSWLQVLSHMDSSLDDIVIFSFRRRYQICPGIPKAPDLTPFVPHPKSTNQNCHNSRPLGVHVDQVGQVWSIECCQDDSVDGGGVYFGEKQTSAMDEFILHQDGESWRDHCPWRMATQITLLPWSQLPVFF